MIEEIAPAKVNLFLHVGPLRKDGLHDLFSLFVFAEDGDRLRAGPLPADIRLEIKGPFADALSATPPQENLVWKAAVRLRDHAGVNSGAALTLDKRLPIAAGVGGGSADAAAALRALVKLWNVNVTDAALREIAFDLGADVPACLDRRPVLVSGAGERIAEGPSLPPLWLCLVNPLKETPTGPVFKAFDAANPSPPPPDVDVPDGFADHDALKVYLKTTRNDLEAPALEITPEIGDVLTLLRNTPKGFAAAMSGSGATCFALYPDESAAKAAARQAEEKGWWSLAARVAAKAEAVKGNET